MGHLLIQGDARRLPFADETFSLVLASPPYTDARLYLEDGRDLGVSRKCREWVEWMLRVTAECLRVSRGPVVWVAAGVTRDRTYQPACEGLAWRWFDEGWTERGRGTVADGSAYRPCYWHRVGIPGSGGDQWFRADVEYAMCFKRPGPLPWTDNTAMGHAPKWAPGGEMSHRMSDGKRVNAFGVRMDGVRIGGRRQNGGLARDESPAGNSPASRKAHTKREANGEMREQSYGPPAIANPGTLIKTTVGGGQLGSAIAHENEAPFPEALAEFFLRSLCPPGGTVLDCFSGSATTVAVAERLDRHGIGLDLRRSQCDLGARRIAAGLRPVSKLDPVAVAPAPGQRSFLDDLETP